MSRDPQRLETGPTSNRANGAHTPIRSPQKESQHETKRLTAAQKNKKDVEQPQPSRDVTELKDYVCFSGRVSGLPMIFSHKTATWRLPWEGSVRLGVPSPEYGHRRDSGCKASQACRSSKERAESHYGMIDVGQCIATVLIAGISS